MTNYEWLIQKDNLVKAVENEHFMDQIVTEYCLGDDCPNKMFCNECTLDPVDIFKRWLENKHY